MNENRGGITYRTAMQNLNEVKEFDALFGDRSEKNKPVPKVPRAKQKKLRIYCPALRPR